MDFTREPIIETVITPKDGCTLVVRSSTNSRQEEYFVDAVEIVTFGNASFYRSRERPKSFLVPVSDYEILEVRETRLVLKNVGFDRSIKIGGGRESSLRTSKESPERPAAAEPSSEEKPATVTPQATASEKTDVRLDKRRERRRNYKRKREEAAASVAENKASPEGSSQGEPADQETSELKGDTSIIPSAGTSVITSLLPPPTSLISETISRYKDNALFRGAFFTKEEDAEDGEAPAAEEITSSDIPLEVPQQFPADDEEIRLPTISLDQPKYGSFEMSEEEEEAVYRERQARRQQEVHDEPHLSEASEPSAPLKLAHPEKTASLELPPQIVAADAPLTLPVEDQPPLPVEDLPNAETEAPDEEDKF